MLKLSDLRNKKGISQKDLAKEIGVSYRTIQNWEKDDKNITLEKAQIIADYFGLSINELTNSPERKVYTNDNSETHTGIKGTPLIPLVKIEAVAGFGSSDWSIDVKDIQKEYLVPDFNGIDFMIYVKGNSMYPKYSSGDIVACRKVVENSFLQWNKSYVIATRSHGIMVKRIHQGEQEETLRMVSDNKEYPPFEVDKEEITGIALVVGVIRLE